MTDLGTLALLIALAASVYGIIVPHLGVRTDNWNLVRSAQHASALAFVMVALASAVLIHALVTSDFSVYYVWGHSSSDMPLFYKITAMWGGWKAPCSCGFSSRASTQWSWPSATSTLTAK